MLLEMRTVPSIWDGVATLRDADRYGRDNKWRTEKGEVE